MTQPAPLNPRQSLACTAAVLLLLAALLPAASPAMTFVVTRLDDPPAGDCLLGDCSLRQAVLKANAVAGADLVQLPQGDGDNLRSCYLLTQGQLAATGPLEIDGTGSGQSCIRQTTDARILQVSPAQPLTLRHLVLRDGHDTGAGGGALDVTNSTVLLDNIAFRSNRADSFGGALRALDATVTLTLSTFEDNQASLGGGAIFGSGQFTFSTGWFVRNSAQLPGGAVSIQNAASQSSWSTLYAVANHSQAAGGAFDFNGGEHALDRVRFVRNTSSASGGALSVSDGHATVEDGDFLRNRAVNGGAISVAANGSLDLVESVVRRNSAYQKGGGLAVSGDLLTRNLTVSGNEALDGAGIRNAGETLLLHVTMAENRNYDSTRTSLLNEGGRTVWVNSILSGACSGPPGSSGSLGGNLEGPGDTCGFGNPSDLKNLTKAALGLAPLAPTGGVDFATWTHALFARSRAVGQAQPGICPEVDQRHYLRADGDCDSGAHERGAQPSR